MNDKVKETGLTLRQLRAVSGLHLLQMLAMQQRNTNYEDFAAMLGLPTSGNALGSATGQVLGDIYHLCDELGIAPLSVLVVRKSGSDKGIPGSGFWPLYKPGSELSREVKRIYAKSLTQQCYDNFASFGVERESV